MRAVISSFVLLTALVAAVSCGSDRDGSQSATPGSQERRSLLDREQQQAASPLRADPQQYDFGSIPINGGKVETVFQMSNTGSAPVRLVAVYTSCGCTTAVLEFADGSTAGPFGMPGHESETVLDHAVSAGEQFRVAVTFDPAAHGPAGTGRVMRTVTIHTEDGGTSEVGISADVVKAGS